MTQDIIYNTISQWSLLGPPAVPKSVSVTKPIIENFKVYMICLRSVKRSQSNIQSRYTIKGFDDKIHNFLLDF